MSQVPERGGRRVATTTGRDGAPGRSARRRLGPAAVLAVVVPVSVVAVGLGLAPSAPEPSADEAPARVALDSQDLVCPPPGGATAPVTVGRAADTGGGDVAVRSGGVDETVSPAGGGAADAVAVAGAPAVVGAVGDSAPGLLAARFATDVTAGVTCVVPAAEQWFTGLGAGPERSSVVELVNPGGQDAVADLQLLGPDGPLDVPDVQGVTVPAGEDVRLDLGAIAPTTDELAARVGVVRGRLGVSVLDRLSPVGGQEVLEWVPAQPEPAAGLLLPGLPGGDGGRTLSVANPGEADTQVEIRVATPSGAVVPVDTPPLEVPAGSVTTRELDQVVADQVDDGAGGLVLTAPDPVTATLRSTVRDDLAVTAAVPADDAPVAGLVPDGDARVSLVAPPADGGAGDPAEVSVVARGADGGELDTTTVEVAAGGVSEVDLPGPTALVEVTGGGPVAASVVVRRGAGTVVLPLRAPVVDGLVPAVRPGLP